MKEDNRDGEGLRLRSTWKSSASPKSGRDQHCGVAVVDCGE